MVSFKNNNVSSEQSPGHRHLPGSLRGSLSHSHDQPQNHLHRHEPAVPAFYHAPPPPPPSSSCPPLQPRCALHSKYRVTQKSLVVCIDESRKNYFVLNYEEEVEEPTGLDVNR
ncbi:hypothetical protein KM043_004845 [Ampulex compressa]|nr:hypothetical protein KM043_004845 [Ampulex compressa]